MAKGKIDKKIQKFNLDTSYTQNRELSWLKFNERVLEEAKDENVPLYERLKFVSIFSSNLDEFFMVRVGSIHDLSLLKKVHIDNKTGNTPNEQLDRIFENVKPLYKKRDEIYYEIEKEMRQNGIFSLTYSELTKKEKEFVLKYYESYIKPLLSPQVVDMHHPFPHLANNELYVCLSFKHPKSEGDSYFGFLPIPNALPQVIYIPSNTGIRYILTQNLILKYADKLFEMNNVESKNLIRVTRNADINPEDEGYDIDDDYRYFMKKLLKKRSRLEPVRLEVSGTQSKSIVSFLTKALKLKKEQVYTSKVPLSFSYVFSLRDKIPNDILKDLVYDSFSPQESASLNKNESIMKQIMRKDILLFYPYEKMDPFLKLIKEASEDKNVVSIKITIYRLANKSKLVEYLINAVENKKEVTVLMELRARFDEENNINWSDELEEAGCKVIYGFDNYKVHSKICLITKNEKGRIQYITQIGTGNYNEKTAKMYTDLSLITSNKEIGEDAALFFKNMSTDNLFSDYKKLLVAPKGLKSGIIEEIDKEIKKKNNGLIVMKMNSLTDRDIIDKLSEASNAGVKIFLNIRGICCLKPEIPNKTENIQVVSIVGRYLEHPRIYCFGNSLDNMRIYIGSADMMTRNTERRVEILTPIISINIKKQIISILNIIKKDTLKARKLTKNGTYKKLTSNSSYPIDSQRYFMNLYKSTAKLIENKHNKLNAVKSNIKNVFKKVKVRFKKENS